MRLCELSQYPEEPVPTAYETLTLDFEQGPDAERPCFEKCGARPGFIMAAKLDDIVENLARGP